MARLEDLIKDIADARLRDQIAGAVAKLKAKKKFGLVFEEHLPEVMQLPGLPVKPGVRVAKRRDKAAGYFSVKAKASSNRVTVIPERGGTEQVVARDDLVAVKRVGEPMYPALIPVDRVTRAPGKPYHTLINADNFHALQVLLYCYEGQVDVIYIDPPYNTGARDWKYNNDYVDKTDQYRHSKWLSMMKKRLELAKRLLKPDGVLICTVDENENATVSLLFDELFPEYEDTAVSIVHNPRGIQGDNFSYCHEMAHFLIRSGQKRITPRQIPKEEQEGSHLRNWGGESTRDTAKNAYYPLYFKHGKFVRAGDVPLPAFHPASVYRDLVNGYRKLRNGEQEFWPIDPEGVERKWRYARESVGSIAHLLVVKEVDDVPQVLLVKDTGPYKTVWKDPKFDASSHGTQLLTKMGLSFPYAKSLYAVLECLLATTDTRKQAVIVDFFAGSGTTLHAAALLNSLDGGERRTILVTNNEVNDDEAKVLSKKGLGPGDSAWEERGIAESVTWPRCQRSIYGRINRNTPLPGKYKTGRQMKDGFEENAQYLRLDFLDPTEVKRGENYGAILPILWMMAGASGELELSKGAGKHHFPKGCPFCVLLREDYFKEFAAKLADRPNITHVFLVTDSVEAFHEMASQISKDKRCVQLYKSYLDNFKINLEHKHAD